jgi:membrane-associated phospholipid phosphatase
MSVRSVSRSAGGAWLARTYSRIAAAITHLFRAPRGPRPRIVGRQLAYVVAAFSVVFVLSMFLFDVWAIEAARRLPRFIVAIFREITDFGKGGWWLWPLAFIFLVLALAPPNLPRPAQGVVAALMVRVGFAFLAIGVPSLFSTIVKRFIGRARPFVGGSANAFLFEPFNEHAAYASLPSGHATTAFAAAVALGALFPRARLYFWIYAVVICISRVVVSAHHPSDVLAGALVGGLGALWVRNHFAARRLGFKVDEDGKVSAFAGPSRRRIKAVARTALSE